MTITDKLLYVCDENITDNYNTIAICDNEQTAKDIIYEYYKTRFDINKTMLKTIGKDGVYSFNVLDKSNNKLIKKNIAEINPIKLNERLF